MTIQFPSEPRARLSDDEIVYLFTRCAITFDQLLKITDRNKYELKNILFELDCVPLYRH